MAYPASTTSLNNALEISDSQASKIKLFAQNLRNASAAGPVGRQQIISFAGTLTNAINALNAAAVLPGMGAYAQEQKGVANIGAEFTAMVTEAIALRDWITTNFPRDPTTQAALIYVFDANGVFTELQFTSAQLATFRTRADALIATIG